MNTLERLAAIHDIQQLAYAYAHAFAVRDPELMLSLWAPSNDEPASMPMLDRQRIVADLEAWWRRLGPCLLHVTNHLVDIQGPDRARGYVHCLGEIGVDDDWVDQVIIYRDAYTRYDGRWLFATREHCLWYGQSRGRNPLRQPPARWPDRQVGAGDIAGRESTFWLGPLQSGTS